MQIALRLSQILVNHFWLLWLSGLAGILAVSIGLQRMDGGQGAGEPRTAKRKRPGALPVACFAVFLVVYLGFLFWNEDFTYQGGRSFTDFSAIGIPRPPPIWISVGRFWPLGHQEYNLIAHLSRTASAYLAFGVLELLIGLWFLQDVMPGESPALRLWTLAVLLMAPAFAADFAELNYADRNVVFALCALVFFVSRYDRRPALRWMIPAVVVSYSALYCKETAATLFGGFAAARVLLEASRHGWRRALRSPLEIGILLGCACFAIQLAVVLIPTGRSKYIEEGSVGALTATARYLTADPLVALFLIASVLHLVQTLRRRARFDPLWDALAAAGVAHFCATAITGLPKDYLLGPTELVAALTLLRLLPAWWSERVRLRPILAAVLGASAAATVTFGAWRLIERKNVVGQTRRVADFLIGQYRTGEKARLYLRADTGLVMNFVSYLSYRGLPFHRAGQRQELEAIEVAGNAPFPNGLCVDFSDFACRHDVMRPGDLVVHLPEEPSRGIPPAAGTSLQPLFEVSPTGFAPPLRPLLAALYRLSPTMYGVYRDEPLRNDWLRVSVGKVVSSP